MYGGDASSRGLDNIPERSSMVRMGVVGMRERQRIVGKTSAAASLRSDGTGRSS